MDHTGKPAGGSAHAEAADVVQHGDSQVDDDATPSADDRSSGGDAETLLELLLAEQEAREAGESAASAPERTRIDGVIVGEIAGFDAAGAPIVTFPDGPEGGLVARSLAVLGAEDAGREVALLFESGDPARPMVMGKMHAPRTAKPARVTADGDRLEISAEREIVLSCGKASITLTRAGKILIRGEYVLSRSNGVHRIQGGSVQIN